MVFRKQHFISNAQLKLAKNQANVKKHPEAELLLFENYLHTLSTFRSSRREVFCKNGVLKNFANSQGNSWARFYFLIKLHDWEPSTSVFLRILRNFLEQLSLKNNPGGYFWRISKCNYHEINWRVNSFVMEVFIW